jgi:3-hydroxy-9,10-secoandrosta-1,3,5(10)-triene-9,17-dione monooxygenase
VPADGGVVLSGEWNFSSGTDHSDWSMLAAIVREGEKPCHYVFCLLQRRNTRSSTIGCTLGMRATSSKTDRGKDVFVPAYRLLSMYLAKPGHAWPGLKVHRNPQLEFPCQQSEAYASAAVWWATHAPCSKRRSSW